jgi:hypothetical protein
MDRATVYTQEQGRSVDFLFAQRATMIAIGKLAQAAMGSNTAVRGLAVTPNSPAALNVLVGIGEIYSTQQVEATPWGSLPADTTDMVTKQGLNMAVQTIATPAPVTGGFSINYLIEAQYQDQDTNPAVLPFYNSANPSIPLNGQGGSGAAQATERQGVCAVQAKAGIAAASGTQVTPTVDSGWTALAVVTVAFGATTVVSGNISVAAGVPQVSSLLQMLQIGSSQYAIDTSATPNQVAIALTPALTAYVDGQPLKFQAANNNSGACTINAGPGSIAVNGGAGALQGGEIVSGKFYEAVYRANTGTAVIVGQSGGAQQINPATASQHALQQQQKGYVRSTTTGSLIIPAGVTQILLSAAAGGAGGGSGGSGSGGVGGGGGGGGAGQSLVRVPFAVTPGSTINWTVGALGGGGAASASGSGNAGAAGGSTIVSGLTAGTQSLAGGGGGLGGGNGSSTGPGGSGGSGSPAGSYGIDAGIAVAGGTSSWGGGAAGGMGASSPFGGGGGAGRGATSNGVAGFPAGGNGAGGGGGGGPYGGAGGIGAAGGAGTAGFVLIEF